MLLLVLICAEIGGEDGVWDWGVFSDMVSGWRHFISLSSHILSARKKIIKTIRLRARYSYGDNIQRNNITRYHY